MNKTYEVEVNREIIKRHLPQADFYDCFSIVLDDQDQTIEQAARLVFDKSPKWIVTLLALRNIIVAPFGLQGTVPTGDSTQDVIGFFPVVSRTPNEIVLGFDDKHLDFRIVVSKHNGAQNTLSAATLVKRNNLFGKIYLFFVKPFHRVIVPAMLKQVNAAR